MNVTASQCRALIFGVLAASTISAPSVAHATVTNAKKTGDIFVMLPKSDTGSAQCKNRAGAVTFASDSVDAVKAFEAPMSVWEIKYDCDGERCEVYETSVAEKEFCTASGMRLRYWGAR